VEQILTKYLIFFYKTSKSKRIKPKKLEKAIDELEKFYNKFKRKYGKDTANAALIYIIDDSIKELKELPNALKDTLRRLSEENPEIEIEEAPTIPEPSNNEVV